MTPFAIVVTVDPEGQLALQLVGCVQVIGVVIKV